LSQTLVTESLASFSLFWISLSDPLDFWDEICSVLWPWILSAIMEDLRDVNTFFDAPVPDHASPRLNWRYRESRRQQSRLSFDSFQIIT
jgi:hypothetical protein